MIPPPEQGDAEMRAAFEAWFLANRQPRKMIRVGGTYKTAMQHDAWFSFQAGYQARAAIDYLRERMEGKA